MTPAPPPSTFPQPPQPRRRIVTTFRQDLTERWARWAGVPSWSASNARGPVPDTVEIESEHEIDTSAAVPGTDVEIGMRGWQPARGSGRDSDSNRRQGQMAASVMSNRNPGPSKLITAAVDRRRRCSLSLRSVAVARTEGRGNPTSGISSRGGRARTSNRTRTRTRVGGGSCILNLVSFGSCILHLGGADGPDP